MGNYSINESPAREAVYASVAPPAGTETFNETQRQALAEVTAALGAQTELLGTVQP